MDDAARQLALVCQALRSRLSNCVEWLDDRTANRVRNDSANQGLTPEGIKQLLIAFIAAGGQLEQKRETRPEYQSRREYWYRTVVPVSGFPRGLFVEMELSDDDPDVPVVSLLNAHPATV